MVTCPKCRSANTPGSTFCIGCGTDLPLGTTAAGSLQPPPAGYGGGAPGPPPPGYGPPPWGGSPQPGPGPPPGFQAPGYPPSYGPAYGVPVYGGPQVDNNMTIAVISLVVGLFGCMITGIPGLVAVIMASQVNGKLAMGDVHGAQQAARHAKVWAIVGLALAAAALVAFFAFLIFGALSVNTTTS